jgi:hypothetical protein
LSAAERLDTTLEQPFQGPAPTIPDLATLWKWGEFVLAFAIFGVDHALEVAGKMPRSSKSPRSPIEFKSSKQSNSNSDFPP